MTSVPALLEGIRVLEWASLIGGPGAASMLGDLGARVIKVEPPVHGDASRGLDGRLPGGAAGTSVTYETVNRNKESVVLNVAHARGAELFLDILSTCDVLITTVSRAQAKRFGIDYDNARRRDPRLVVVYGGSGWGPNGPDAGRRAMDVLVQAASGLMAGNECEPLPAAPVDNAATVMLALAAVSGLLARERHEVGQEISTSLFATALQLQATSANRALWRGESPSLRLRRGQHGPMICWYVCSDGAMIMVCEQHLERFWAEFCEVLAVDPQTKDDLGLEGLVSIFDERFATKTRDEWLVLFRESNVRFGYAPVNSLEEATRSTQALANDYVIPIEHEVMGQTLALGFPLTFSAMRQTVRSNAPEFGEHTDAVLAEVCGLSSAELISLKEAGVIH